MNVYEYKNSKRTLMSKFKSNNNSQNEEDNYTMINLCKFLGENNLKENFSNFESEIFEGEFENKLMKKFSTSNFFKGNLSDISGITNTDYKNYNKYINSKRKSLKNYLNKIEDNDMNNNNCNEDLKENNNKDENNWKMNESISDESKNVGIKVNKNNDKNNDNDNISKQSITRKNKDNKGSLKSNKINNFSCYDSDIDEVITIII